MSRIFESQNQFIIRFPQQIAQQLEQYFDNPETTQMPLIQIQLDKERQRQMSSRIALKVDVNNKQYKATVMQLPTISSTFKTLDKINFFKSNDISQIIVVHNQPEECDLIYEDMAEKITDRSQNKIMKLKCQSGITPSTKYIRQQNFKQKPDIDKQKLGVVDEQMEKIRSENSKAVQKQKQQAKQKKQRQLGQR